MKKIFSERIFLLRTRLIQWVGILLVFLGLFLAALGVHVAAGGANMVIDLLWGFFVVEVNQVSGLVFSIVGTAALVPGIAFCYVGFKLQRLNVACMILGSCGLIIPGMILGMGYNLAAGITAIIIGYPWLATFFLWLMGGERE